MFRFLQNHALKNVDAQKTANVDMKRGTFVKINEKTQKVEVAPTLADVYGVAVRDVKVTDEVAQGLPVSEYDLEQDVIVKDEYLGVMVINKGERCITTEFDSALVDADVEAGKYLTVVNGKLAKPADATATHIVSLGFLSDAGHKVLGYKFV